MPISRLTFWKALWSHALLNSVAWGSAVAETNWRELCRELVMSWDVDGCDWKPQHQARWNATVDRARTALAEPQGEGPTAEELGPLIAWLLEQAVQAADADQPTDAGMLTWAAQVIGERVDGPAVPEGREPASVDQQATAGEAGELVVRLRETAVSLESDWYHASARLMREAADLLTRLALQPVPVSERLPGPEDCTPNPRNGEGEWCWGWRQDSSRSPFSGRWHMVPRAFVVEEASHWLPADALPLPAGEVADA